MKLKSTEQNHLLRNKLFSENKNIYLQFKKNLSTISVKHHYFTIHKAECSLRKFRNLYKDSERFCAMK